MKAYHALEEDYDIIVIEGAGSPAEINLKSDDIVNMGMAKMANAPVLLVGDIDRGGVFAQLVGTVMLLTEEERERVKGLIINKFRGDKTILDPGIEMLKDYCDKPVVGVVPYMDVDLEDEDSLSERMDSAREAKLIDIAVIRFPRISNFTDFNIFESIDGVSVRYVRQAAQLENPDMIILPGTKNTMGDLRWLRQSGMEAAVLKAKEKGTVIFGVCGGYQMLGQTLTDPEGVEEGGTMRGMGMLPMDTVFCGEKTRTRVDGTFGEISGVLSDLSGISLSGYEIHMGQSMISEKAGAASEDSAAYGQTENIIEGSAACGQTENITEQDTENGGKGSDHERRQKAGASGDERNPKADLSSAESRQKIGASGGERRQKAGASDMARNGQTGILARVIDAVSGEEKTDGLYCDQVYGTYVHGIFDREEVAGTVVQALAARRGIDMSDLTAMDYAAYKEHQYDRLADILRQHLDMEQIYKIMGAGKGFLYEDRI